MYCTVYTELSNVQCSLVVVEARIVTNECCHVKCLLIEAVETGQLYTVESHCQAN